MPGEKGREEREGRRGGMPREMEAGKRQEREGSSQGRRKEEFLVITSSILLSWFKPG